jgi:DNA-binding protein H-NS
MLALKAMPISRLEKLKGDIDKVISTKVAERRQELELQLSALSGHERAGKGGRGASMRGRVIAPKYRNPDNPSETWSGRGLKPRWMSALLKERGRKVEDFLIVGKSSAASSAKQARKTGKMRKTRK